MNPVLAEIENTSMMALPSGETIKVHSHVGRGSGQVIRHAIEVSRPRLACEVGLAYGISSLYILDAMQQQGGGRLIGMDPAQHDGIWRGGGLYNIQRAGFSDRFEFHEDTSQRVLPRLAEFSSALLTAGTRSITPWWISFTLIRYWMSAGWLCWMMWATRV